ncbi:hypothetical protein AAHA92_00651 [Salvia divinorum]|uniref:Endonuclease/exonuclease/phosphatase domain-containing protein n=1 Tax=Salvia divinorum TaxID=28513 RepID=A0ABD1IMQ6_SALDI
MLKLNPTPGGQMIDYGESSGQQQATNKWHSSDHHHLPPSNLDTADQRMVPVSDAFVDLSEELDRAAETGMIQLSQNSVFIPLIGLKLMDLLEVYGYPTKIAVTFVYDSPQPNRRHILWEYLSILAEQTRFPWILAGDFNAMLNSDEKLGSSSNGPGFCRAKYMWNRGSVYEHLDRAIGNELVDTCLEEVTVFHLTRIKSDHRPILIKIGKFNHSHSPRPFRYFSGWLQHGDFSRVVRENWSDNGSMADTIATFTKSAKQWNHDIFGSIRKQKKWIMARLKGAQEALERHQSPNMVAIEKQLQDKLELILDQEEALWKQKS